MKTKKIVGLFCLSIVWGSLLLTAQTFSAAGAVLTVKPDGTGNYKTVQAALEAAKPGDTVTVYAGTYTEDTNIGHFNIPSEKKDNIILQAAAGATVEIVAANLKNRANSFSLAGMDIGAVDHAGFLLNGDNVVVEGIRFVQNSAELSGLNQSVAVIVAGSNDVIRNCEIVGPAIDSGGDIIGLAISALDVIGLSQGKPSLATHLIVENCKFTNAVYGFAMEDFLHTGQPPEVLLKNCEFFGNGNAVQLNDGTLNVAGCNFHDNRIGLHTADDTANISGCVIQNNSQYGIDLDFGESEDNEPPNTPVVTVDQCFIADNGTGGDQYGIRMKHGTLTVKNTIISGSSGANVFFETIADRASQAVFDHCDLYESQGGIAVLTTDSPKSAITFRMTNSIVVDIDGILNRAGTVGDFRVDYCDLFVTGTPLEGDFTSKTNILNVNPQYVDPGNGNFFLKPTSTLIQAGQGGTYLGAKGTVTSIPDWRVYSFLSR